MPKALPAPMSVEDMRALFGYEPGTGRLFWKAARRGAGPAGTTAGCRQVQKYLSVMINGTKYQVHVIIWYIVTGDWIPGYIDHEDVDGGNNRWSNLRVATRQQNGWNRHGRAASGYKGVYPTLSGKWTARIKVGGKIINFPSRVTPEEAFADYCGAVGQHQGPFARIT